MYNKYFKQHNIINIVLSLKSNQKRTIILIMILLIIYLMFFSKIHLNFLFLKNYLKFLHIALLNTTQFHKEMPYLQKYSS